MKLLIMLILLSITGIALADPFDINDRWWKHDPNVEQIDEKTWRWRGGFPMYGGTINVPKGETLIFEGTGGENIRMNTRPAPKPALSRPSRGAEKGERYD